MIQTKQATIEDIYHFDNYISTPGVKDGLLQLASEGDPAFTIEDTDDGKAVYYKTPHGEIVPIGRPLELAAAPVSNETRTDAPSGTGLPSMDAFIETMKSGATGEAKAINPSMRKKISSSVQDQLESFGMDRYRARKLSESLFGGESSGVPMGLGLIDFVPIVGTALQSEEAGIKAGEAFDLVKDGKNSQAAAKYGEAVLTSIPGAIATKKIVDKAIKPFLSNSADKAAQVFEKKVSNEFDSLVNKYSKLEGTEGGRILNTDDARELSDAYRKDRTLSSAVQKPASDFIEKSYDQKLASPTPDGLDSRVLILGGGAGSGKSSGRIKMGSVGDNSEIIYDTTLSNLETAQNKVEKALKAKREVVIGYTARDPVEAFYGVLERAMRQEKELGTGRTVPLEVFVRQHIDARENIDKLATIYGDNPNVRILGIDNTLGKGKAKGVPLADIPKFNYNGLEEKLHEILREEYQAHRISESVYAGTLQNFRPQQRGIQARTGDGQQLERDSSGAPNRSQQNGTTSQQLIGSGQAPASGAE